MKSIAWSLINDLRIKNYNFFFKIVAFIIKYLIKNIFTKLFLLIFPYIFTKLRILWNINYFYYYWFIFIKRNLYFLFYISFKVCPINFSQVLSQTMWKISTQIQISFHWWVPFISRQIKSKFTKNFIY